MTTGKLRVGFNDHDDVVITNNVTPPDGFEAENTQNIMRSDLLRTSGLTTMVLTCVAPETRIANSVFMFRHLLAGASVRFQFFTDTGASSASTGGDSGTNAALCYTASEPFAFSVGGNDPYVTESAFWYHYAAAVTYRSYKITVSGTPTYASVFEIGRIAVCKMFEAAVNPDYGAEVNWKDQTKPNRTDGASYRARITDAYRTMALNLSGINENERSTWLQIKRAGRGVDLVATAYPGDGTTLERDHCGNWVMSSIDPVGRQVSRLTTRLQLEEV